ncbi:hypothetical protein ACEQPO_02435 [Bacillus sp. SL00103]
MGLDRSKQDIQEMIHAEGRTEKAVYVFFKTDKTKAIEERLYQSIYTSLQSHLSGEYSVHLFPEEYWKESEDGVPDEAYFKALIEESGQDAEDRAPQTGDGETFGQAFGPNCLMSQISAAVIISLLGGHSLKATQMLSAVRQRMGFDVPLFFLSIRDWGN